jgi:hypothetical protein
MPQQNLLPDHQTMTAVQILVEAPIPVERDFTRVKIGVATSTRPLTTYAVIDLEGTMTDFLGTLVEEAVLAWAYGERPKDVATAAAAVRKQARSHAALYDF